MTIKENVNDHTIVLWITVSMSKALYLTIEYATRVIYASMEIYPNGYRGILKNLGKKSTEAVKAIRVAIVIVPIWSLLTAIFSDL